MADVTTPESAVATRSAPESLSTVLTWLEVRAGNCNNQLAVDLAARFGACARRARQESARRL